MKTLKIFLNLFILFAIQYLYTLYCSSEQLINTAVVPAALGIGLGAAALQTGLGAWQAYKAGKMKVDDSQEKKAIANMEAQQKGLIDRAKGREFMDMPGQDRMESNISASTSQAVKSYREMGSQAGYQDFLNQALQSEQQKLADLGVESARFKLERSKDVDQAMAGMKDIEAMKYRRGVQLTEQQKADIAAAKQTAASNISGGIQSAASVGMMAANKGLTN